jgi:hypothetical protein
LTVLLAFQPVAIGKNSRQRRLKTGLLENLDTNRRDFHAVPLDVECRYRL